MYEVIQMNSKDTVAPSIGVNTYLNFVAIRELNTLILKFQNPSMLWSSLDMPCFDFITWNKVNVCAMSTIS